MNSISLFVLLIFSKIAENSQNTSFNCEYLPNNCKFEETLDEYKYRDEIFVCNDLTSFDFDSEAVKRCKKNKNSYTKVYFRLSTDKILDRSFEFSSIDNFLNKINTIKRFDNQYETKLKGINGFDIYIQTSLNQSHKSWPLLIFLNARFEFYYKNKLISSCEDFTSMNLTEPKSVFQLGTKTRQVNYNFDNTRFPDSVCPYLFNNIQSNSMDFKRMIKTFYKSSYLKFSSNNKSEPLNSYVNTLYFSKIEKLDLDSNLLNEKVFKDISYLSLDGEMNSIEEGIFKSFTKLRSIYFQDLEFFENLIHKGTRWISSINHGLHVNLSNRTQLELNINRISIIYVQIMFQNSKINEFMTVLVRDEDFCLFIDFPFDQMVLLLIYEMTHTLQNLSCTLVWLVKDYHLYYKQYIRSNSTRIGSLNYLNKTYLNIFQKGNWTEMIEKCDFRKRLENCDRKRFEYTSEWNINDTKEIVILLESMLIFIIPLVGLFGLLTNTFIVFVVSLSENKEYLKAKQYSYMRIASLANALVCFISMFTPIYQCQSFDGIFCSSVHHLVFIQYFKIICVEFISSVLKMISNFSYLGFLIARSSLIGKNHGKFIQIFSGLSVAKFMFVSLLLSVIFSIVKIFRYELNTFDTDQNYPIPFDRNYCIIICSLLDSKSSLT